MKNVRMLTIKEAALSYGVAVWAIRTWVNTGQLPAVKTGRKFLIAAQNIENFLMQGNNQSADAENTGGMRRIK